MIGKEAEARRQVLIQEMEGLLVQIERLLADKRERLEGDDKAYESIAENIAASKILVPTATVEELEEHVGALKQLKAHFDAA